MNSLLELDVTRIGETTRIISLIGIAVALSVISNYICITFTFGYRPYQVPYSFYNYQLVPRLTTGARQASRSSETFGR